LPGYYRSSLRDKSEWRLIVGYRLSAIREALAIPKALAIRASVGYWLSAIGDSRSADYRLFAKRWLFRDTR
jgi:hypothetical protein